MSARLEKIRSLFGAARFAETVDEVRSVCKDTELSLGEEWRSIANAATKVGDLNSARVAALRWCREEPEKLEALAFGAQTCGAARQGDMAMGLAEMLVGKFQDAPISWFVAGELRAQYGDVGRAIFELKRAFEMNPQLIAAWRHIAALKKLPADDSDADYIRSFPERTAGLPDADRATALQASAIVNDRLGDCAAAFSQYSEAARIIRSGSTHVMKRQVRMLKNVARTFDEAMIERNSGYGADADGAVFVIGTPRSGAALIEQILASHSNVVGAGEASTLRLASWPLVDLSETYIEAAERNARNRIWRHIGGNYDTYSAELFRGGKFVVNRDVGSIAYVGLIALALPKARIIFCDRDPMDAAWSSFKTAFPGTHHWSKDFNEIAEWFGAFRSAADLWRQRLPDRILNVSYEALTAEPEKEIRKILAFVGIEATERSFSHYETPLPAPIHSVRRIRAPIDRSSVGGWRAFEKELSPLRAAMERFGALGGRPPLLN